MKTYDDWKLASPDDDRPEQDTDRCPECGAQGREVQPEGAAQPYMTCPTAGCPNNAGDDEC